MVEEVTQSNDTILFIDELHTLVGAGAAEGAIDAANILKPALARGELQCIGATTLTEYRQYIEKDAALERRFQPVEAAQHGISALARSRPGGHRPTRLLQGCSLDPRGAPSPLGCRRGAAALRCLPTVADPATLMPCSRRSRVSMRLAIPSHHLTPLTPPY